MNVHFSDELTTVLRALKTLSIKALIQKTPLPPPLPPHTQTHLRALLDRI